MSLRCNASFSLTTVSKVIKYIFRYISQILSGPSIIFSVQNLSRNHKAENYPSMSRCLCVKGKGRVPYNRIVPRCPHMFFAYFNIFRFSVKCTAMYTMWVIYTTVYAVNWRVSIHVHSVNKILRNRHNHNLHCNIAATIFLGQIRMMLWTFREYMDLIWHVCY